MGAIGSAAGTRIGHRFTAGGFHAVFHPLDVLAACYPSLIYLFCLNHHVLTGAPCLAQSFLSNEAYLFARQPHSPRLIPSTRVSEHQL